MKQLLPKMGAPLLALMLCVNCISAQIDGIHPTSVAQNFYNKYLDLKIRGLPDKDQAYDLSRYFSSEIYKLLRRDQRKQEEFIKKHPDEKPPWVEGDLFTSLFEGATSFNMGRSRVKGSTREVDVHLVYDDGANTSKWTDTVILKRFGKRWRITIIIYKGKWQFKSGSSLLNVLR